MEFRATLAVFIYAKLTGCCFIFTLTPAMSILVVSIFSSSSLQTKPMSEFAVMYNFSFTCKKSAKAAI